MQQPSPNLNAWWCDQLFAALQSQGIKELVLCPGNRNVPLAFAADKRQLRIIVHQDERSAAFAAMGMARCLQRPVAICVTSGSAVANCLPAVVEAWHARLPLVVISADRPPHLHDCEAPQTIRQSHLFEDHVSSSCQLPLPAIQELEDLHSSIRLAFSRAQTPIHINVPMDDPLPPLPDPSWQEPETSLPTTGRHTPTLLASDPLPQELKPGMRGLIIAGPRCPLDLETVNKLARATGFPVLADACSSLRRPAAAQLITCADALCSGAMKDLTADVLIRLGPAPVSRPVWEYCSAHQGAVIRIDDHRIEADFCHEHFTWISSEDEGSLDKLMAALGSAPSSWLQQWHTAETTALDRRQQWLQQHGWNESQAFATACQHRSFTRLHLGNSLAIRHANCHVLAADQLQSCTANRGANGIDGTISTFIGQELALLSLEDAATSPDKQALLILGDLSFLHDLPALQLATHAGLRATILVIDNQGGAIFDLLPVAALPAHHRLITAPSALDCAHAATAFGLESRTATEATELQAALDWSVAQTGVQIVVAKIPPEQAAAAYRDCLQTMAS